MKMCAPLGGISLEGEAKGGLTVELVLRGDPGRVASF